MIHNLAHARTFIEAIDAVIAEPVRAAERTMAEADSRYYERERYLGCAGSLVPLTKTELTDDSISTCEQVMTRIAARYIASRVDHWGNCDSHRIALLGYLIAERRHHAELVSLANAHQLVNILEAAE